ncbi:hypothetical protein BEWA_017020 [Theileria equi strain WA]|uniref:WDHD1/CFT4 second beta-propeller domain-containing protein n=1 Tax=Theileria equi strain WA TaxID=1537102 RepID=L1LA30_THEEQ|nr:hypothetical protein BEWA_017020 [Theileria equi strain WA]EKX72023.1 hypothetical protein BEWA_017020 [Theileria equi strain WA]|eukprot:XP_004831475.1 hypothetical protein BEWA_017020 [Theileria equi strain WA]
MIYQDSIVLKTAEELVTIQTVKTENAPKLLAWHPLKPLLAVCGDEIEYTSHPKWELYKFGGSNVQGSVANLQFAQLGDLIALVTLTDQLLQIWDFDTQSILYSTNDFKWTSKKLIMNENDQLEEASTAPVSPSTKRVVGDEDSSFKKPKRLKRVNLIDDEAQEELFYDAAEKDIKEDEEEGDDEEEEMSTTHDDFHVNKAPGDDFEFMDVDSSLLDEIAVMRKKISQLEKKISGTSTRVLMPGSCPPPNDQNRQWCLFWDEIGQITKQGVNEGGNLHIYIFSGPLAGYIRKPDKYNCHTAALTSNAFIVGSNLMSQDTTCGIATYSNLSNGESWERRFKDDSLVAVAVTENFSAVLLKSSTLAIFTLGGSLISAFRVKGEPISLAAQGNLLLVVSGLNGSNVYSARLIWVNGLRGLARNGVSRIVNVHNEDFTTGGPITHIGLSNYTPWIVDSQGDLLLLLPVTSSFTKLCGISLEWVPTINIKKIGSSDDSKTESRVFPLYISNLQLCYIKLREGQKYPESAQAINFMGYTLHRAFLRLEMCSSAYLPFSKYSSMLSRDPLLKEIQTDGQNQDMQVVSDIANIPWQQYDDMRHMQALLNAQGEYILKLQNMYRFWIKNADNLQTTTVTSMVNSEKAHDKWLLRVLRKTKDKKQDNPVTRDAIQMLRMPKCLDAAKSILADQIDFRQRQVLQDSLMLLAQTDISKNKV